MNTIKSIATLHFKSVDWAVKLEKKIVLFHSFLVSEFSNLLRQLSIEITYIGVIYEVIWSLVIG